MYILLMLAILIALILKTPQSAWGTERVGSSIGMNENTIGIMLAVAVLFLLYRVTQTKRWIYLLLCVPFVAISLMTGSRKAFFIIPFLLIAYLAGSTRGFKGIVAVFFALVATYGLFWLAMNAQGLYDVIGVRLQQTFNVLEGGQSDLDIMRNYYRQFGWELFTQKPLFGYGMSGFQIMLADVSTEAAYSHCNYIELLSCYGIVGFGLFYHLYAVIINEAVKSNCLSRQTKALVVVLLISLVLLDYGNVSYPEIITYLFLIIDYLFVSSSERANARVVNYGEQ